MLHDVNQICVAAAAHFHRLAFLTRHPATLRLVMDNNGCVFVSHAKQASSVILLLRRVRALLGLRQLPRTRLSALRQAAVVPRLGVASDLCARADRRSRLRVRAVAATRPHRRQQPIAPVTQARASLVVPASAARGMPRNRWRVRAPLDMRPHRLRQPPARVPLPRAPWLAAARARCVWVGPRGQLSAHATLATLVRQRDNLRVQRLWRHATRALRARTAWATARNQ